ncbi:MAG: 2-amino-4-hydroxy-6-hydroxymethyldihydropteridine diphosphokinase [Candidatus Sumerlaeaceae bacterium]
MSLWVTAYLGLGANLPLTQSPDRTLCLACARLRCTFGVHLAKVSSLYRSKPWGETNQPEFYNAVVRIETMLSPRELLGAVKNIERELGRTPTYRWGPRVIDIDILLYGDSEIDESDLMIPHRHLLERPFAYVPLIEIAPEATLPDGLPLVLAVAKTHADNGELEKLGSLAREVEKICGWGG